MPSRLPRLRSLATAALAVTVPAALAVAAVAPAASARTGGPRNEFSQTNLVSNLTTVGAQIVDPNLVIVARASIDTYATSGFTAYLDYVKITITYTTTVGGNIVECNSYNNWTVTKSNPPT